MKATHAFIEAWSECLLWVVGKLIKGSHHKGSSDESKDNDAQQIREAIAEKIVDQQFQRFMSELWNGLHVHAEFAGQLLANTLQKLDTISKGMFSFVHFMDIN